jgi:hypothetical protein
VTGDVGELHRDEGERKCEVPECERGVKTKGGCILSCRMVYCEYI